MTTLEMKVLSHELEVYLSHITVMAEIEINAEEATTLRGIVEEVNDLARAVELADDVVFAQVDLFQTERDYERAFQALVEHRKAMRAKRGTE